MQYARVKFDNTRLYSYKFPDALEIAEGDLAVVETGRSFGVATVVRISDRHDGRATKYIVGKVDLLAFEALKEKELNKSEKE